MYSANNSFQHSKSSLTMRTLESVLKIVVVILALLLVSCEEKIELRVNDKDHQLLVVEGMITSDTTNHVVKLSSTGGFYHNDQTPRATGASVSISDNMGNVFPLAEVLPGKYMTENDVYGQVGRTYTLTVDYDGARFQASSTMKRVPEIDSLSYRWDPLKESYRILLYGQEPEGKGDHYLFHLYKNGEKLTDPINKATIVNDEFIDGRYINGFEVDWWSHDFDFQKGDVVTVAQHSITSEAFEFIAAVFTEHTSGQAGSRPPANIPSNVSNNALGLFHAAAISCKTIVIE